MPKAPKPFVFVLTPAEAAEILAPAGSGGQQSFHDMLRAQLANANLTVTLDDADLGKLIRYMSQYKSGGFQDRLKKAFMRSLLEQLGH